MKTIAIGLLGSLALGGAAFAGATPDGTVRDFIAAFDRGDAAAAAATHAADVSIVDEVAPHIWQGPGAFQKWADDLTADAKANGQSGNKVTLGELVRSQVDGDTGYVTFEALYSYDQKGGAMAESARMVFALKKTAGDWKIAGWAWAGSPPKPLGAR